MSLVQVMSAIIFLNLLIAVMNTTVQKVQEKRELYWKFARASVWIRFFDDNQALPPPFNCFNIVRHLYCKLLQAGSTMGTTGRHHLGIWQVLIGGRRNLSRPIRMRDYFSLLRWRRVQLTPM